MWGFIRARLIKVDTALKHRVGSHSATWLAPASERVSHWAHPEGRVMGLTVSQLEEYGMAGQVRVVMWKIGGNNAVLVLKWICLGFTSLHTRRTLQDPGYRLDLKLTLLLRPVFEASTAGFSYLIG